MFFRATSQLSVTKTEKGCIISQPQLSITVILLSIQQYRQLPTHLESMNQK